MNRDKLPARLQQLMQQVSGLTREGRLQEATQALQQALGASPAPAFRPAGRASASDGRVIDVDAVEVGTAPFPVGGSPGAATPCADAPRPSSFSSGDFRQGGRALEYKLFVPSGPYAGPRPLLVMLHGCTQDPDDFAAGTQMNRLAQDEGYLVLYPAQSRDANPQRCWNWFKPNHQQRGRGEPALLAALARHIAETHGVDPGRIYVAGLSAGGAMAAILAHAYPDVFAAAGVHSGLAPGSARDAMEALQAMRTGTGPSVASATGKAAPAPIIVFHGDRDGTVHPEHGNHVVAASLPRAGMRSSEERGTSGRGLPHTLRVHRDASDRVLAEYWIVHGLAHAWSGGNASGSYTDPRGPDASREMLRFFRAHGRRAEGSGPL